MSATPDGGERERVVAAVSELVGCRLVEVDRPGRVGGFSHEAIVLQDRAHCRRLLVRLPPRDGAFPPYDVVAEGRLMQHLSGVVPVPVIVAVCDGLETRGRPFVVAEWLKGRVVLHGRDPVIAQSGLEPDGWARWVVATLAQIHGPEATARCSLVPAEQGLATRTLDRWAGVLEALSAVRGPPAAWLALSWLRAHMPAEPETTLTHGDFRLGNLLWQGEHPVVLDWEHATLGDPLADLGWLLMSAVEEEDLVMGLVPKRRVIELYGQERGVTVDRERLLWWEVLATWVRFCMEARLVEHQLLQDPPDLRGLVWDAGSARTKRALLQLLSRLRTTDHAIR